MKQDYPRRYISKSGLKREYRMTDLMILRLGDPDIIASQRVFHNFQMMKLYRRDRVEAWLKTQGDQKIEGTLWKERRKIKREKLIQRLVKLAMRDLPDEATLELELVAHHQRKYHKKPKVITPRAICSFIRHFYTNYDQVMIAITGGAAHGELYQDLKLYLCCLIIRHYGLSVDPLDAAFGPYPPARYPRSNLEDHLSYKLNIADSGDSRE